MIFLLAQISLVFKISILFYDAQCMDALCSPWHAPHIPHMLWCALQYALACSGCSVQSMACSTHSTHTLVCSTVCSGMLWLLCTPHGILCALDGTLTCRGVYCTIMAYGCSITVALQQWNHHTHTIEHKTKYSMVRYCGSPHVNKFFRRCCIGWCSKGCASICDFWYQYTLAKKCVSISV